MGAFVKTLALAAIQTVRPEKADGCTIRVTSPLFYGQQPAGTLWPSDTYNVLPALPGIMGTMGPWVSYRVRSPQGLEIHLTDRPNRGEASILHVPFGYTVDVEIPNWVPGGNAAGPAATLPLIGFGAANAGTIVVTDGDGNRPNLLRWTSDWCGPLANGGAMPAAATIIHPYSVASPVRNYGHAEYGIVKEFELRVFGLTITVPAAGAVIPLLLAKAEYAGSNAILMQSAPTAGVVSSWPLATGLINSFDLVKGDYRDSIATGGRNLSLQRPVCFDGNPSLYVLATALTNAADLIYAQTRGQHEVRL